MTGQILKRDHKRSLQSFFLMLGPFRDMNCEFWGHPKNGPGWCFNRPKIYLTGHIILESCKSQNWLKHSKNHHLLYLLCFSLRSTNKNQRNPLLLRFQFASAPSRRSCCKRSCTPDDFAEPGNISPMNSKPAFATCLWCSFEKKTCWGLPVYIPKLAMTSVNGLQNWMPI